MNRKHTHSPISNSTAGAGAVPLYAGYNYPRLNSFTALVFSLGILINAFSYHSFAPVAVAAILYTATYALLVLTPLDGGAERFMFSRAFSVGYLMAGVAAVYGNQLGGIDLFSDADVFFEIASSETAGLALSDIQLLHENALVIAMWRDMYDFFGALGFEKSRYIGISINVTAVALSGVIGIKMARQIFGNDEYRFRRLTLLVSACGLFWLFAGIHLRDSIVLLAVTGLSYAWLRFLVIPGLGWRLLRITLWSSLAVAYFGFLRLEFVFVPVGMVVAAVMALLLGHVDRGQRFVVYVLMLIGVVTTVVLAVSYAAEILVALERGTIGYDEQGADTHGANSLGMALIVNQVMPIRLVLGSIYLFVFPIPFWSGFQLDSAYALFKSANVIFFYFLLPLLLIAITQLLRYKAMRTPAWLFLVFLIVGFTLAVAASSLETRHFGAFLLPIFVLGTLPDLRDVRILRVYKQYLFIVLTGVVLVHFAWIVIKFV